MTKRAETVRVNSRIGKTHNEWLDNYSRETGISKSSLIMMAVDFWITNKQSMGTLEKLIDEAELQRKENGATG